jgi:hypothetical protein
MNHGIKDKPGPCQHKELEKEMPYFVRADCNLAVAKLPEVKLYAPYRCRVCGGRYAVPL